MGIPFLVVAGITVPVDANAASEDDVARGKIVTAYDGSPRSTMDPTAKRVWTVTVHAITPAGMAALRVAAPPGSRRTVSGRMVNGGTGSVDITCIVTYGARTYGRRFAPSGVTRATTLTLYEA